MNLEVQKCALDMYSNIWCVSNIHGMSTLRAVLGTSIFAKVFKDITKSDFSSFVAWVDTNKIIITATTTGSASYKLRVIFAGTASCEIKVRLWTCELLKKMRDKPINC